MGIGWKNEVVKKIGTKKEPQTRQKNYKQNNDHKLK